MNIIADESVDSGIVRGLRNKRINVFSISENYSGYDDKDVLLLANEKGWLLITEDKDFGELTYRLQLSHKGILLLRLTTLPRKNRINIAIETIENHYLRLQNNFSVLDKKGLRIKTAQKKS